MLLRLPATKDTGPDAVFHVSSGLCALSINNDNCYLAYPGSASIGEVQVFDTINLVRFLWH